MTPLVELTDVSVCFSVETSRFRKGSFSALDEITLHIAQGEILGVVGESGSGKSTLARLLVGLVAPSSGSFSYRGADGGAGRGPRHEIQMIFQDSGASLNPAMTVRRALREVLRHHHVVDDHRLAARCSELLELVRLPESVLHKRPRELSGGQRQRVALARALAVEPKVLIADEAVAGLDAPVRAAVVNLLADLREQLGLTVVFIAHDLPLVRNLCDRVATMYLGRIVEIAAVDVFFGSPQHPYTRALIDAVPTLTSSHRPGTVSVRGEPPNQLERTPGCRFAPRCPVAESICGELEPELLGGDHLVACHVARREGARHAGLESVAGSQEPK